MGRDNVTGGNSHSRMTKLIARGPRVRCSRMATYFNWEDTNPDGHGGRIAKDFDTLVHDQTVTQSKHKKGKNWHRGIK